LDLLFREHLLIDNVDLTVEETAIPIAVHFSLTIA